MIDPSAQSESALEIERVAKIYRLYRKPAYRVLDLLGLCPKSQNCFTEHKALDDVSLTVGRGEKVAIIGRNGAGKSTLLKIITGAIQPTSGKVRVHGKVSALLQIGTGFHPDFTGRQNAYSSMALQGITGKTAHRKFEEIVDFAELEEYIDQPMKTYSTGMCARLMFSAAIVVTPDILVVDEVLGVGDAYFTHKSFDRMRQICTGHGTTLLLVTHDVYSAMNLCDRFIWIDQGRMKMDAAGKPTLDAYDQSIKEQEEIHLRHTAKAAVAARRTGAAHWYVKIASRSGFALPKPLGLWRIELGWADGFTSVLEVASHSTGWTLLAEGNLGPVETREGRACRSLAEFGSIFHKAEWMVAIPRELEPTSVGIDYLYDGDEPVIVTVAARQGDSILAGDLEPASGWQHAVITGDGGADAEDGTAGELGKLNRKGNGRVLIESIEFLDESGKPCFHIPCGQSACLRVGLKIRDPSVPRGFAYSFGMRATHTSALVGSFSDELCFPADSEEAIVTFHFQPLLIGSGRYFLSFSVYEPDVFRGGPLRYVTANPKLYCSVLRPIEFVVDARHPMDGVVLVKHPVRVEIAAPATRGGDERLAAAAVEAIAQHAQ
jgi:lipopolysaccharide transport system ATP-binding protein